ncbi:CD1375 family protein [Paenibacillus sp. NPDC058910]
MAKIYCDLIRKDLKTIDDVPFRWKDQVQELLEADTE